MKAFLQALLRAHKTRPTHSHTCAWRPRTPRALWLAGSKSLSEEIARKRSDASPTKQKEEREKLAIISRDPSKGAQMLGRTRIYKGLVC